MSVSAALGRTLFKDKNGGAANYTVIKHRFLSFLIWQSFHSTLLLFLSKTFFLFPFTQSPYTPSFNSLFYFVSFHFCLLLFAVSLFFLSSPNPLPSASPLDFFLGLARILFISRRSADPELRKKIGVSLSYVLFVSLCAVAGAVSSICICWGCDVYQVESKSGWYGVYGKLGFRGFVVGLFYGLHYVYKQRWLLQFPIIQLEDRPSLSSWTSFEFSAAGYLLSGVLAFFLLNGYTSQATMGKFICEQIIFYTGSFVLILCWELSHHLHQVLHTKRFVFAPPKGSAAAETNPSEPLLDTLEESTPKSLLQYLAYLDLCMVCESNVDTWRRAAFFEESGEAYRRVMAVFLRPLEELTRKLNESLDNSSIDNSFQASSFPGSCARQLGVTLDDSRLEALTGNRMVSMNYYPVCPNPELTVGVGRHSDIELLTVLLQDDIGGLYVKVEENLEKEEWVEIPPIPGALVINVGDSLQILSNDRFRSAEHRVRTMSKESRVSIPSFPLPKPTEKIGPLPQIVEREGIARYKEVLFQDYQKNFVESAHEGKSCLDFARSDAA